MMSPIASNVLIGIAITEGGVIPATLLYLGSFYKSYELATRLAWFWGVQVRYRTMIHKIEDLTDLLECRKRSQWTNG